MFTFNFYFAFQKLLDYLRFSKGYGKLIELYTKCFSDIMIFFILYVIILLMFSLWNYVLELEIV